MAELTGSARPVDLGEGYAIRAPGVQGRATLERAHDHPSRAGRDEGTEALDAAFAATGVTEVRQVDVRVRPSRGPRPAEALRGPGDEPALELRVPDLGPEVGQVVLAADEAGVLTWHLPVGTAGGPPGEGGAGEAGAERAGGATRGRGDTLRFLVPAEAVPPPEPEDASSRSLVGALGRKLLKVLVYKLTDPVLGAVSDAFAGRWEARNRPYRLRTLAPDDFRTPGAGELDASAWPTLRSGRALLLLHGTFSTTHGAFAGLPDDTFRALWERYGGRVLGLDHYTLSHDPRRNATWLLDRLPGDGRLEVDVLCHSRGGLVARTLAEGASAFGLDTSPLQVRRVVFVGVPNRGTVLADPDHMVAFLDRYTSVLNLFPAGPVSEVLEGIITAVKMVGRGALGGLDGLAAMRPDGPFLRALNAGPPPEADYFAVAADYEPVDAGLRALVTGTVKDAVADRVFQDVANDLVVPEPGVWDDNGSAGFPIPAERTLRLPPGAGVVHTTLFGHPGTGERLTRWLTA